MSPPSGRAGVRHVLHDVGRTVRRADLAVAYCTVVTVLTLVLSLMSSSQRDEIVERTSSNLVNLRDNPVQALVASAFVVPHVEGLVMVAILLVVLAYSQRFVGRLATVVVGFSGHVGATVLVAAGLQSGIFHGFVDPDVRNAVDVGVSYVAASVMGFLTLFVPGRWRWFWLGGMAVYWLLPGAVLRTFTDAGHVTSLAIGLLMAFVAARAVRAEQRHLGHGRTWDDPEP